MSEVKVFKSNESFFYELTRPLMLWFRFIWLFPVANLKKASHEDVRFVLKSPAGMFCILNIVLQMLYMFLSFFYLIIKDFSPRSYIKFAAHFGGAVIAILFLRLARIWPRLLNEVAAIEASLPRTVPGNQRRTRVVCYVIATSLIFAALVELVLRENFYLHISAACGEDGSLLEFFYSYTTPWLAYLVPFNLPLTYVIEVLNVRMPLIILSADIIVISVSLYLTSRFRDLNALVILYKDKFPCIWGIIRVHHNKLIRLVKILDDATSPFTVVCFGNNLAFICVHLYKLLKRQSAHHLTACDPEIAVQILSSISRTSYFLFAFFVAVFRMLLTSLVGAQLHNTAQESIAVMYEVPTMCYNAEAQRFLDQMYMNKVALSGHHFFYLTKSMISSMALTITTYEMVLMQFSAA